MIEYEIVRENKQLIANQKTINKVNPGLEYLHQILDIAKSEQKSDYDSCFVIVGKERTGKSNLMLHALDYLGEEISSISMFGSDFIESLYHSKECGTVALDEAGNAMFSRDTMTRQAKTLVKLYQAIGGKKLITFLCLPGFFRLDRYFREDRVTGLFYVYARGRYVFYAGKNIKKIINQGYIKLPKRKSSRRKYYPKYNGRLLKDYEKMKSDNIKKILQEAQPKEQPKQKRNTAIYQYYKDGHYTMKEIGKKEDLTEARVSQIIKREELKLKS